MTTIDDVIKYEMNDCMIMENKLGDFMLQVYLTEGIPENPQIVFKPKEEKLLLYRNDKSVIHLKDIKKDIYDKMIQRPVILVIEVDKETNNMVYEYITECKII